MNAFHSISDVLVNPEKKMKPSVHSGKSFRPWAVLAFTLLFFRQQYIRLVGFFHKLSTPKPRFCQSAEQHSYLLAPPPKIATFIFRYI